MHDAAGRRGLWFKETENTIELCSGREGDDAHVVLPKSKDLLDVLEYPASEFETLAMHLIDLFQLSGDTYLTAKKQG